MDLRKCLSALTIAGLFSLSAIPTAGADRSPPYAGLERQTRTFMVASSNNYLRKHPEIRLHLVPVFRRYVEGRRREYRRDHRHGP